MQSLQRQLSACCQEFQTERQVHGLSASSVFCFPASFSGFAGHFPDRPVLPAIVQLAAIRHTAELALARPLIPAGFGRTKFQGMISPDEKIRCTLLLKETDGLWTAAFSIRRMDYTPVANGNCTFFPEH